MTPQQALRQRCLALRDYLHATGDVEVTSTISDGARLTVTRDTGAVLVAGERTLAISEEWIEQHGLTPAHREGSTSQIERQRATKEGS